MSQQPRFNEARYYRYPKNRIVSVLNDDRSLDDALRQLPQYVPRRGGGHYLLRFHLDR